MIQYFSLLLATLLVTTFLAWQAWKQRGVAGSRHYFWLALAMSAAALGEILSVLSPSEALASLWFNARFLSLAVIPPLWLLFVLKYSGRKDLLPRGFVIGLMIVPFVTQVMVWTGSLHTLWVYQEVSFQQAGPFWVADISRRIPGIWYLVHIFYGQLLLLVGSVLLLRTAWRNARRYRLQAAFLTASALVPVIVNVVVTFNLLPPDSINPTMPSFALAALLAALAIFRFDFLKRAPRHAGGVDRRAEVDEKRSQVWFLLIFILLLVGLSAVGFVSYQEYATHFRSQIEEQLTAIAALKTDGLVSWHRERMADAQVLRESLAFSALVARLVDDPADGEAAAQMQTWLDGLCTSYDYSQVGLLDTSGTPLLASPPNATFDRHLMAYIPDSLQTGQLVFVDFHRHESDQTIHLSILVPVYANLEIDRPLGIVVLDIDPATSLYPYLAQWPGTSQTAESLLVRREGSEVLFLNPLQFDPQAALTLRFPLADTDILAVKAVLGETGVREGSDYREERVIGHVGAVPGTPWFLVTRQDTDEVLISIRQRMWQTIIFFASLIAASGAGLTLVWRQQRLRHYRERLLAAGALQDSEARFRKAFQTSPDGITITRIQDGRLLSVNEGFCRILGYSEGEVLGKTSLELNIWVDPADHEKIVAGLREHGQVTNYDASFRAKDGSLRQGLMSASLIELGGEKHILQTTRDVSERKQAEEALRESEDKFKYVFDYSNAGKSITLPSGEVHVNNAFATMLGYTSEELEQTRWQDITHPEDLERTQKEVDAILRGEKDTARFTKRYLHKNGAVVWADVGTTLRRGEDGKALYFMSTVIDITAGKQAEQELEALSARQKAILAAVPDILMEVNTDKVYCWGNPAGLEFFGEDVISREAAYYFEGAQDTYNKVQPLFNGDEKVVYIESWQRRKDGEKRLLAWWCKVLKDANGNPIGSLSSARDITETALAQEEIQKLNMELEKRVQERTRELEQAQEKLLRQERLATLGQVAGSIGHELRNPLGVISNAVYFLKMTQPEGTGVNREYLDIIENETRIADKTITDLLNFARVKSKEKYPVVVADLVKQALERFPLPAAVALTLKIPSRLPGAYADPDHLVQVLGNLVRNAVEAMPAGGRLGISARRRAGMVAISVQDSGCGILAENMVKMFEPLFSTKPTGIGLGLAISRKLIEANDGRIEVQSQPGKGSTFTVYVPLYKETV
jgi:PAS domain S-box-containing protein